MPASLSSLPRWTRQLLRVLGWFIVVYAIIAVPVLLTIVILHVPIIIGETIAENATIISIIGAIAIVYGGDRWRQAQPRAVGGRRRSLVTTVLLALGSLAVTIPLGLFILGTAGKLMVSRGLYNPDGFGGLIAITWILGGGLFIGVVASVGVFFYLHRRNR